MAHSEHHEKVKISKQAFLDWRKVPAPLRGEVIRQFGNELRDNKIDLAKRFKGNRKIKITLKINFINIK